MAHHRAEMIVGAAACQQIVASDNGMVALPVIDAALYFMAAGYFAAGKALFLRLWNSPLRPDPIIHKRALDTLFHFDPAPPDDWELDSLRNIELAQREYIAGYHMEDIPDFVLQTNTLQLFDRIKTGAALHLLPVRFPSAQEEREALIELENFIEQAEGTNHQIAKAYILATELAAKNGHTEKAIALAQEWARRYTKFWSDTPFAEMLSNVHVTPLLLQGILAEPLGIPDSATAQVYFEGLYSALESRLTQGQTLASASIGMRALLERISAAALAETPERFSLEQHTAYWIGYPPATAAQIAHAETRLGVTLPADYRAFLLESNGFPYPKWLSPELMPVEHIGFLRNLESPEQMDLYRLTYPDDFAQNLEQSLKIGHEIESSEILLFIPLTDSPHLWACWFCAHWVPGEVRYPSFRAYLQHELERMFR